MSMISLLLTGLAVVGVLAAEDCEIDKCNVGLFKFYKDFNCVPTQEAGACCPSNFDCPALANRRKDKCHLKGKSYDMETKITDKQEIGSNCVYECRCQNYGRTGASLMCRSGECLEWMREPPAPGCTSLYTPRDCCPATTTCSNNTQFFKDDFKCQYGGKSYSEGERFWPSEKPCVECLCQNGFDGTLNGPWCKDINCELELYYGRMLNYGCAPVYSARRDCCPKTFRCPASRRDAVVKRVPATKEGAPQCVFGRLRLNVGEVLNNHKKCVVCTCEVPPAVSCIQTGRC